MIKFKRLDDNAIIPRTQRDGDAGLDITTIESKTLWMGEQVSFKTGLACAIPAGYVGVIKPRSGLALKNQIDTKAGIIDSNYRGELVIILRNDSAKPYDFQAGDRIAQMLIIPCITESCEVDDLDDTDRGKSGFGSSGK